MTNYNLLKKIFLLTGICLGMLFNGQAQTSLKWATILPKQDATSFWVSDIYFHSNSQQLFLTGSYNGNDFPATRGTTATNGTLSAFIIAMNADGSQINWSQLIQGSNIDRGTHIYVDDAGDIFLYGDTRSTDFPVNGQVAAYQATLGGSYDCFLHRYNSTGTVLKYATYIGDGSSNDWGGRGGTAMVVRGDKVYAFFVTGGTDTQGFIPPTGYIMPEYDSGTAIFCLNTAVAGNGGLEVLAYHHSYYNGGALNVAPDGSVYFIGPTDMYSDLELNIPDISTPDAILNRTDLLALSSGTSYGYIDRLIKLSPDLSTLEYASFILPIELSVNEGSLDSYDWYDLEVDDDGNLFLYSTYWIYDDILSINYPANTTINNPFNMQLSTGNYGYSNGIGMTTKIAANDFSKYEYITILPEHEFGDNKDIELDAEGNLHMVTTIIYHDAFPFTPTASAGAPLSPVPDNSSSYQEGYYIVLNPDGSLRYATPYDQGVYQQKNISIDKENCTTYLAYYSRNAKVSTPSYYNQEQGQQVTLYNSGINAVEGSGIQAYHHPKPENVIQDFAAGNNTFCVDGLIAQGTNDGPILGDELIYVSGDGSSPSHNLPDLIYNGATIPHPTPQIPTSFYQWQISRDNGASWTDISGASSPDYKPAPESTAGTVQYRRVWYGGCSSEVSNVATANIVGGTSLTIDTPENSIYYCEGTAENIPITISGAVGTISWQWYNDLTPLTNADISPASGSGVAPSAFTATLPASQTGEGFYRLVVEDANGCKQEAFVPFSKLEAAAYPTGNVASLCYGTNQTELTIGPSTIIPFWEYSWTGPNGFTSNQANPTVTATGDYFLVVKPIGVASFCTASQTVVTVSGATPHDPLLTTIPDHEFCQSSDPRPIGLSGNSPAGYVFQWAPGNNLDDQQAYSPNFDPGDLPFDQVPIATVEYTFAALRLSDGCIYETTTTVTDTALALANAGPDHFTCGTNMTTLGSSTTTGLEWQWQAIGTSYPGGLPSLLTDPEFLIDDVNTDLGTNKFARVQGPVSASDCYHIDFVLRASYIPFPTNCFTTDTVRICICPEAICSACPLVHAELTGEDGVCSNENSLITVNPFQGFDIEYTTYSIDGVVQAAGTPPRGLFTNNNGTQGIAIAPTGPHPIEVIVNIDDPTWGWAGANVVTYKIESYGYTPQGIKGDCSQLLQVFSAPFGTPVIGVLDKTLCVFPSGTQTGGYSNTAPYTVSGIDYTEAPNSGFEWDWTATDGSNTNITLGENTPFPTLEPAGNESFIVALRDQGTGCIATDTMNFDAIPIRAEAGDNIEGACPGTVVQLGYFNDSYMSYSWSPTTGLDNPNSPLPQLTVPNISNPIDYILTATNTASGCQVVDTVSVSSSTNPPIGIVDRTYDLCRGDNRYMYLGSNQAGFTYSWTVISGGGSLSWFSDLTVPNPYINIPSNATLGTYVFQLTKSNNCGSTSALLTLNVLSLTAPNLGPDITPNCTTPYTALSTPTVAGQYYGWTPRTGLFLDPSGTIPLPTSYNVSYNTVYVAPSNIPQTYTITTRNAAFCTATDEITVNPASTLMVNAGPDQAFCLNGAISLGLANAGVSHTWAAVGYNSDPDATPAVPNATQTATMLAYLGNTNANVTNFSQATLTEGVYVYALTSTSASGCSFSDEVTIKVRNIASGLAGSNQQTCRGGSVSIGTASIQNYSYLWSAISPSTEDYTLDDPTLSNPTVTPVVTTTYQVVVTDLLTGCHATDIVTVNVSQGPDLADVSTNVQCAPVLNQDITNYIPNYGSLFNPIWYQNSVPGILVPNPNNISLTQTTTFYLVAENDFGCSDTAKVIFNVEDIQNNTITGEQDVCNVQAQILTSNASSLSGSLFYQWQASTSSCSSGFTDILGATSNTYFPGIVNTTTYYRLIVSVNLEASSAYCTDISNCITINSTTPTASAEAVQSTCTANTVDPNSASLQLLTATGDRANYSLGNTYNGDPNYANAIDISSVAFPYTLVDGLPNPSVEQDYTIRVFNGRNNCFRDVVVTLLEKDCTPPNTTIANDDTGSGFENEPITGNILANDTDPEGNFQFIMANFPVLAPSNGTVTVDLFGNYTYTPNANFVGTDQFVYEICDNGTPSACDQATVTLTILEGNDAPIATDDLNSTIEDFPVSGNVATNDNDPDGDNLTVTTTPVSGPSFGTVILNANGTYTYTPNAGFVGTDVFVYEICDDGTPVACDQATVTLTVLEGNNPPIATDDLNSTIEDFPVSGNVATNDNDPDGDNLIVTTTPVSGPSFGTVILNANGTYTYTPNAGFVGTDAFVYEICDDGTPVACDQATVTLTVLQGNNPPKAIGDLNFTIADTPVSGDVTVNDIEPDGDPLIVNPTPLGGPSFGSIVLNPAGTYTYTPNPNFVGQDSLLYIVCDDFTPPACDTGVLKIVTINPSIDIIIQANDDYYINGANQLLNGRVLENDISSKDNGLTLNFPTLRGPNNGTLNLQADGNFTYLPDLNFIGEDEFEYVACSVDEPTVCDTAIVFICIPEDSPSNEPPFAADDVTITYQDVPVQDSLLNNDWDVDGDNIVVSPTLITQPNNGTVIFNASGIITYTPNQGYIGPDNFIYEVCDDGIPQLCAQGTFYVIVLEEANTAPIAINDDNVTFVNTMITGQMLTNDFDLEGDSLVVNSMSIMNPMNGNVSINANGAYTYMPNANYVGTDNFEYEVCEFAGQQLCDTALVAITIIPTGSPNSGIPPIGINDDNITYENMAVNGNVLANDVDPEGTTMTASVVIQPNNGSVTLLSSGDYTYTPNTNFIGNDQFTYLACDGGSPVECVFAMVFIEVLPMPNPFIGNLPPVAGDDFNYTKEEETIDGILGINDQDPEGDSLIILNVNGVTTGTTGAYVFLDNGAVDVQPDGQYTYTPNAGFRGTEQFTYEISDGENRCSRATVYLAVGEKSCIDLQLKVLLEGAMVDGNQNYLTEMRTDLNTTRSILPGQTPVNPTISPTPAGQPYNIAPYNYNGTDVENTYAGPYDTHVVDWVLVSLRTGMEPSTVFRQAVGLLKKDGTIEFLEPCVLSESDPQSVYIVVEHRNHLGIMTPTPVTVTNKTMFWDFTTQNSYTGIGGFGQKEITPNTFAMFAGDNDQESDFPSYDITGLDKILWTTENGNFDQYRASDFDMNGDVNGADKIIWSINNGTASRVPK